MSMSGKAQRWRAPISRLAPRLHWSNGAIATVVLNRPAKLKALTKPTGRACERRGLVGPT
jgi:hypothetical protein